MKSDVFNRNATRRGFLLGATAICGSLATQGCRNPSSSDSTAHAKAEYDLLNADWSGPGGIGDYRLANGNTFDVVGPLKASIMIGILWVIWHMAVPFSPLLVDTRKIIADPHFWTFQLPYFFGYMIVGCLGMSVVMTHFYIKTGSSLSGILIHSGFNSTIISFGLSVHIGGPSFASQDSFIVAWLVAGIMAAAALLIITIYGRGLVSPEITETVSIEQNT